MQASLSNNTLEGVHLQIRDLIKAKQLLHSDQDGLQTPLIDERLAVLVQRSTAMDLAQQKRRRSKLFVFDVRWSDDNNSHFLSAISVHGRDETAASWAALDIALETMNAPKDQWEQPFMEAGATHDWHDKDCDCDCHNECNCDCHFADDGDTVECSDKDCKGDDCELENGDSKGCDECWRSESIMMERCPTEGEHHFGAHSNVWK